MKLKDTLTLLAAGYSRKDIEKMEKDDLEVEKAKEAEAEKAKEAEAEKAKEAEAEKAKEAEKADLTKRIEELTKQVEDAQKQLKEAQRANINGDSTETPDKGKEAEKAYNALLDKIQTFI